MLTAIAVAQVVNRLRCSKPPSRSCTRSTALLRQVVQFWLRELTSEGARQGALQEIA